MREELRVGELRVEGRIICVVTMYGATNRVRMPDKGGRRGNMPLYYVMA